MNDLTAKDNESVSDKMLSAKSWIALGVVVLAITLFLVARSLYQAQPADVVINPDGLNNIEYAALTEAVAQYEVGGFFTAPLPKLQQSIMQEGWISQVNIERKWGEGIIVHAVPRQAVAHFGTDYLIDAEGVVFKPANKSELMRNDLIRLQGDAEQSTLIMQQLQQVNQWFAPLNIVVEDMVLTPRMTWVVKFDNGLRVIVDNEQTSQKLMNLSQMMQTQLHAKRDEIASFDLRYKNGFVIGWKEAVT